MKETKETTGKSLNFDKDNKDNSGELANLLIWFVMYRVYVR